MFWSTGKARKKEMDAQLFHRIFHDPGPERMKATAGAHGLVLTNESKEISKECVECPAGGGQKPPHRSTAHATSMKEAGAGWSVDTSAPPSRELLNGERCLMAMVEDSVGYTHLALLVNAEMQRQTVVARCLLRMSAVQTRNQLKLIRGDGAYRLSQI